jgi:RNA-directed DNA polymerase
VREGYEVVVDIDLEKFFDRANHDILMSRLAKRIEDKRLLKIIRRFLEADIMKHGVCIKRDEGLAQGGPLSPLISNLLLDDLNKKLECRGHKFCRYADNSNIYVKSLRAGERALQSVKQFLEKRLKLKVNKTKSSCASVYERKFLGHRLLSDGRLVIAAQSITRLQNTVREVTRRNRGASLDKVIYELNEKLRGWINYFRFTEWNSQTAELDAWIRRKMRCYRLKQRKSGRSISKFLRNLGVFGLSAKRLASSGKGWWRLSMSPPVSQARSNAWFDKIGLMNLTRQRSSLNA